MVWKKTSIFIWKMTFLVPIQFSFFTFLHKSFFFLKISPANVNNAPKKQIKRYKSIMLNEKKNPIIGKGV